LWRHPQHPATDDAPEVTRANQPITVHPTQFAGREDGAAMAGHTLKSRQRSTQLLVECRQLGSLPPSCDKYKTTFVRASFLHSRNKPGRFFFVFFTDS
jgi:hypothetical protein